jgi:hypothetical protein
VTSEPGRDFQAEADRALAELLSGLSAEQAALALATLSNRVATRLHTLARAEASARKGQPDWPAWAQLQNASRTMVLQASTCRDLARRLAGPAREAPPEERTPPSQ